MLSLYLMMIDSQESREKIVYIYDEFYTFMEYVARQYVNNKSDAEDIIHDCMLAIIACIDKLKFTSYEETKKFCAVVVRNHAIDFCKNRDNRYLPLNERFLVDKDESDFPFEVLMRQEAREAIFDEIEKMSQANRDVCILKFLYFLQDREVATLLGLSADVVSMRSSRGRRKLQARLKKEGIYERL